MNHYQDCHEDKLQSMDSEYLDHMWILFNNLEDTDAESVVESALFFVETCGFDIEVLPLKLLTAVEVMMGNNSEAEYWYNLG